MKKVFAVLMIAVMLISMAACGSSPAGNNATDTNTQNNTAQNDTAQNNTANEVPTAENRTVTDILGRKVEIPAEVNKIIALSSAGRFIVYAGAAEKIVGLSELEMKGDPGMPFGTS